MREFIMAVIFSALVFGSVFLLLEPVSPPTAPAAGKSPHYETAALPRTPSAEQQKSPPTSSSVQSAP